MNVIYKLSYKDCDLMLKIQIGRQEYLNIKIIFIEICVPVLYTYSVIEHRMHFSYDFEC